MSQEFIYYSVVHEGGRDFNKPDLILDHENICYRHTGSGFWRYMNAGDFYVPADRFIKSQGLDAEYFLKLELRPDDSGMDTDWVVSLYADFDNEAHAQIYRMWIAVFGT